MEEIRKIAQVYYKTMPKDVRRSVKDFFKKMDRNEDRKVSQAEFVEFMAEVGYVAMNNASFFKEINKNKNGELDFDDVKTLYYILESGRPLCGGCEQFINGAYFTCVECFTCEAQSFCLHPDCFHSKKDDLNHTHSNFLDNYALLEFIRRERLAGGDAQKNKSSKPRNPIPSSSKPRNPNPSSSKSISSKPRNPNPSSSLTILSASSKPRNPIPSSSKPRNPNPSSSKSIITWPHWSPLPAVMQYQFAGVEETSRFQILLEGPICQAWHLGKRFPRQTLGLPKQIVPVHPLEHMRDTKRFTAEQMAEYTIGWDTIHFRGIGDYREYMETYIMRPLSDGRRVEGARPVALAAKAGVGAGAGASRRARVRGRGEAQRGRGAGWPALPTTVTCRGRGGATYQIPIAPPPADHELVGFYDLPPASSEYTRQSLELAASVMGMLQQSLDLLSIYNIPPPFQIPAVEGAPAGPSAPVRGKDEEGRVFRRTKAGRTHVGSSSRAPVPDDDDDESEADAEEEARSSEEETGDSSGSDSDDSASPDDASGPSSRKRTMMDSQA